MTDDPDFEKWVQQWAAAEEEMAKEKPVQSEPKMKSSYFTGTPAEYEMSEPDFAQDDWHDIYQRAMEIDYSEDNLILDNVAYMGNEGFGKEMPKGKAPACGGKKVYTQNPIHFASVGNDQQNDDGRTRVTDNWSDGEELRELDYIKRQVEAMEREFHKADVMKKSDRSKLQTELKDIRDRVKELSEKLTSNPQTDLA
jgi:hypothetical protein